MGSACVWATASLAPSTSESTSKPCALAQEVRSPFAGKYRLTIVCGGEATTREHFDNVFLKHFTCKLQYYQYTDAAKKPVDRKELESLVFRPPFAGPDGSASDSFVLEKEFLNPTPGQNFSFGLGMGVAVIVEKTTEGALDLAAADRAALVIHSVTLEFIGKERNKDVQV